MKRPSPPWVMSLRDNSCHRAALDEHGGRIAHALRRRPVNANTIGEDVSEEMIARRPPQLRAGVRAVGEVVVLDQIIIRLDEVQAIPHAVGFIAPQDTLAGAFEQNAAARGQLAPAMLRVVVVVGEIAALDEQRPAIARHESGGKASRLEVADRHIRTAFEQDADARLLQGFQVGGGAGALQRRALAVNRHVAGANDQPGVPGRALLHHEVIGHNDLTGLRGGNRSREGGEPSQRAAEETTLKRDEGKQPSVATPVSFRHFGVHRPVAIQRGDGGTAQRFDLDGAHVDEANNACRF